MLRSPDRLLNIFPLYKDKMKFRKIPFLYVDVLLLAFGNRAINALHCIVAPTTASPLSTGSSIGSSSCEYKEIERLALASSKKIRGSKTYYKAWRHWSEMAIDSIRNDLIRNLPTAHPVVVGENEATTSSSCLRKYQLGMAADYGIMPSHFFQNAAARSGYAVDFFCRARLLGDLMMTTRNSHQNNEQDVNKPLSSSSDFMLSEALEELWSSSSNNNNNNSNKVCRLTSIGGGPGYDFVAAAMVASFRNSHERITTNENAEAKTTSWSIQATILDYEEGWYDLVDAMSQATTSALRFDKNDDAGSNHVAIFGGKCDITKPLWTHPSNSALLRLQCGEEDEEVKSSASSGSTAIIKTTTLLDATDIWTIQYCVAENAQELIASNFVFFHHLFQGAKVGAIFIITEVTHRLWPDLVNIAQSSSLGFNYQVAFQRVRRKGGYHLVLQKRAVPAVMNNISKTTSSSLLLSMPVPVPFQSVDHLALLRMFELDGERHQRKIDKGCVRQVRKMRGAK